jgi:SAM-dependent methyltransferase
MTSDSPAAHGSRPRGRFAMRLRKRTRKLIRRLQVRTFEKRVRENTVKAKPPHRPFPGTRVYWEERYASGGNSGVGSYRKFAEFKAQILNEFIVSNSIGTVIEFGCGDGNQLLLTQYPSYLGLEVSTAALKICQQKFAGDPRKSFKLLDLYAGERADLALSLDVIFHLIADEEFEEHMRILFNSSDRFVIIYSSNTNVNKHDDPHVKHRKFTRWIKTNAAGWSLDRRIANRYPYKGDFKRGSLAEFYIYRRSPSVGGFAAFLRRFHDNF